MTSRTWILIGAVGVTLALLGFMTGLRVGIGLASSRVQALQIQAAETKGAEDAAKAEVQAGRQAIAAADANGVEAGRTVMQLRREVARLRKEALAHPDLPQDPAIPVPSPVDLAPLVAKQDDLIAALDAQHLADEDRIQARDKVIDSQAKALKLADLRADIQEQASKAALQGIKQSRWLGRAEGFAAGVAMGYAGGRYR